MRVILPLPARSGAALLASTLLACSATPAPLSTSTGAALDGTVVVSASQLASGSDLALLPGGDRALAVDFAGTLELGGRELAGAGPSDALLVRVDAGGRIRWLLPLSGPGVELIAAVAPAPGGVVIAGSHGPRARLGDRALPAAGSFVARLDDRGEVKAIAVLPGEVRLADVVAAPGGSLCAAGWFAGELELGRVRLHSAGSHDALIACFTADGAPVWARRGGGPAADQAAAVVADGGRVIAAGGYGAIADFDGTELTAGRRGPDGFVAAWALADGTPLWRQRFGGPDRDAAAALALAADGEVWMAGSFTGSAAFGDATLEAEGEAPFIARIDGDGAIARARAVLAGSADATTLAAGAAGPIVAGSFAGTAGAGQLQLSARGERDIYVVSFDRELNVRWARQLGGHDQDGAGGLAAAADRVALAGTFVDELDAGGRSLRAAGQSAFTGWLGR